MGAGLDSALPLLTALPGSTWLPLAWFLSAYLGSFWLRSDLAALKLPSAALFPAAASCTGAAFSAPRLGASSWSYTRGWPSVAEDEVCRADPYTSLMDRGRQNNAVLGVLSFFLPLVLSFFLPLEPQPPAKMSVVENSNLAMPIWIYATLPLCNQDKSPKAMEIFSTFVQQLSKNI